MATESPRAALEYFRGDWSIRGHESAFVEKCDWLAGKGFVACHAEDRSSLDGVRGPAGVER